MMLRRRSYEDLYARFRWDLPDELNLAHQVCDGWAATEPDRIALIDLRGAQRRDVTYGQLWELSRRVEAALIEKGVMCGDRVGVLLSQSPLCAAAHIATWRLGVPRVSPSILAASACAYTRQSGSEETSPYQQV